MTAVVGTAPPRIYLDHAATTPPARAVVEAMLPYLVTSWGNPSSPHAAGRAARAAVDGARDRLAAILSCAQREIVFTSGGTEADNLALRGVVERWGGERGRHLVVSAIEHEAVLATALEMERAGEAAVTVVGVDATGVVDPARVADAVRDDTVLVSVMTANNEVGTIQPVAAVAEAVRRRNPGVLLHTDAVQALGRAAVSLDTLGVDLLSLSAHKCHGPKGTGALVMRWGTHLRAQAEGGGQERGRRSGTENVAGIVGFATAAELVAADRDVENPRVCRLRDDLERRVAGAGVRVACTGSPRLPFLTTFLVDGTSSDVLVAALDQRGVEVSGGSACSSGAVRPSHVLAAIGEDPARTALLRCSLGRDTTESDVDRAAFAITEVVATARSGWGS
ncbi:MAG: cysteine desulfurase family protein [Candidatus Dormibacteria bacterium]